MNIRQLDNIVSWLLQKFKYAPYKWNEQHVHNFIESVGLTWAIPIVTIQTIPKQRSQNYQQEVIQDGQKLQIPLLDICTKQYEQIFQICNSQGVFKVISHSIDINLYYQIQKLKIWSLILLKYQNYREILKKQYGSKLFFQQKCKNCSAEISCSCSVLSNIIYEIEIYIKSIYELPNHQNNKRRYSMFISSDIINLLIKSISHLPQIDQSPLFWDMDDIKVLLYVIKFQDYYQLLYQNQIDGFVLLLLVNPPFQGDNQFLKSLLLNQDFTQKTYNDLVSNRQTMVKNNMQTVSKYHQINQLAHLLHYLLQILSFTVYKNQEFYNEYKNLGQRKVSEIQWLSLYYFPKTSKILQLNRNLSDIFEQDILPKSFDKFQLELKERHKTEMINPKDMQIKLTEESIDSNFKKQFSHPNVTQFTNYSIQLQNNKQLTQFKDYNIQQGIITDEINKDIRELILIQDYIDEQDRDLKYIETKVQIEEDIDLNGNVNLSQEEQIQELPNQQNQEEFENKQLQESVFMMKSVLLQQYSALTQQQQKQQLNQMQESVLLEQSTFLQSSIILQLPELLQHSQVLDKSIQINQIIEECDHKRIQQPKSFKEQILSRIQKLSLVPIFDPFQLFQSTHLKVKCDEQQKVQKKIISYSYSLKQQISKVLILVEVMNALLLLQIIPKLVANIVKYFIKKVYKFKNRKEAFYLIDIGSKGGTFIKINNSFVIEKDMSFYIGNRFAFKIMDINTDTGFLEVRYEHEGKAKHKLIQLKKGDKFLIGRERSKNNFTFMHSQFNYNLIYQMQQINECKTFRNQL
ncbi:unnamed protein product [Paramecium sonneborni]|uniref:Uncharacterized protein n=1 Tax=Paramecium sonneborni TaxID=65129 RepID=A0A8S1LIX2_9CILI|nr:unnamed protein product [Paramecium sonneborni]